MLSGILNVCSFLPDLETISFAPKVSNIIKELLFPLVAVRQCYKQAVTWNYALKITGFNEF